MDSNDIKSYLFERAFSMKSSLSIIAQMYLCKFNDTLSMFAFTYEDSFRAKILRDDCDLNVV